MNGESRYIQRKKAMGNMGDSYNNGYCDGRRNGHTAHNYPTSSFVKAYKQGFNDGLLLFKQDQLLKLIQRK